MRLIFLGTDEGIFVSGAAKVVHGQVFARDIFEIMGPGSFYLLAAFFKLFGVTFLATRIDLFLISLGTGLLIYYLSRQVCEKFQLLPVLIMAATYFGMLWPEISHHVDSNFFALASVACLVLWHDVHRLALLLAAGMLAGATTFFLQPKGILLLIALFVWLWIQTRQRDARLSALARLLGGYGIVVAAVLIYFWTQHALWDLVYATVVFPAHRYGPVNVVPYASGIRHYWSQWASARDGFHWSTLLAALLIVPFLFVVVLPCLLLILNLFRRVRTMNAKVLLLLFCGSALWLSESHRKDIYHLVFGSPLIIIVCVVYLEQFRAKASELVLQVLAITAVCLMTCNLFLVLTAHSVQTRVGTVALFTDDPALAVLDQKTTPGQEVFCYPGFPIYNFLSATVNPTRYSGLMYGVNPPSDFEEVVRVLEQRQVKYVVWNTGFEDTTMAIYFPAAKRADDRSRIIEPYLNSHYKIVWQDRNTRLLERTREAHANQ